MPKKLSQEEFIARLHATRGDRYDYSKVKYKGSKKPITILCATHGQFEQLATSHLNDKQNCPNCSIRATSNTTDFIRKAKQIHPLQKYNYDKTHYLNARTPVIITCVIHGDFQQKPNDHLSGYGCSKCNISKAETYITNILINKNLTFTPQYKISSCKNIHPLPFDFAILENNVVLGLIEFNGRQHYEPIWGKNNLKKTQINDKIKKEYCRQNNIPFLVIPYTKEKFITENVNKFLKTIVECRKNTNHDY